MEIGIDGKKGIIRTGQTPPESDVSPTRMEQEQVPVASTTITVVPVTSDRE